MLTDEMKAILEKSRGTGWVLEPDAKKILSLAGLDVPEYIHATSVGEAEAFASKTGYPLVAKVVSPDILHKSDVGGVAVGISSDEQLREVFDGFSKMKGFAGAVIEEMLSGVELIVGAKNDSQFGPVIILGIGGIGVEIYKDTTIRMAPIKKEHVPSMVADIKARKLLEGFRGSEPVNMECLSSMVVGFSNLVMDLAPFVESIDLNPVMCSGSRCVIADARMILNNAQE
ncbi:MAG: acetate--CoA ligase family protein [Candidatus Krumholzibacteria bacterium]|nr:acetate--CoA ligase family protein [Candidatus Krumholzibacteria bacterium]